MEGILPRLRVRDKERLLERMRTSEEAALRTRYLIILNLDDGISPTETAHRLKISRSTVYRVAARFREVGEAGLVDRREDNGERKLDEHALATLYELVRSSPQEHGWRRPTWTREMLAETLRKTTGVRLHVSTMSKALQKIGARRGQPKPTVRCPWSKQAKNQRLAHCSN